MKDVLGKNLPEIVEVTLLSSEELEACEDYVTYLPEWGVGYYYLRTAYEDNQIGFAIGKYDEGPTDPDWEDDYGGRWQFRGYALRPILRLVNSSLKDGGTLEAGDNVVIGKTTFTAISETILLADNAAWFDVENLTFGYFDDKTNVYENSLAKQRVDAWFEETIKPNL